MEWDRAASTTTPPALFEAQTAGTPQATALVVEAAELSYAQLNARANRLAHHLIRLGAGPERAVAVALPRTVDMVVAMLAVLKSGAVYVPVAPDQPADRTALSNQPRNCPRPSTQTSVRPREACLARYRRGQYGRCMSWRHLVGPG